MNINSFLFAIINIVIIVGLIYISYVYHISKTRNAERKNITFLNFINGGQYLTLKNILVGLSFGFVFGFIDNFGLWVGIEKLEQYMPGGVKTKAALGNIYSDLIGATVGTSISVMLYDYLEIEKEVEHPLWLNTIGIVIGGIVGLIAGRFIVGGR